MFKFYWNKYILVQTIQLNKTENNNTRKTAEKVWYLLLGPCIKLPIKYNYLLIDYYH